MNNTVKMILFGFPKVKWLRLTGEVDKPVRFLCQIFSGFNMSKINWLRLTGEVDKPVRFLCQIFSGFNMSKINKIG